MNKIDNELNSNVYLVVPARLEASRFPGKLLKRLRGKPILQWVFEALKTDETNYKVIIATDSERIAQEANQWGASVFMSQRDHQNGTSRCIEFAESLNDQDIIINVQGDEPFVKLDSIKMIIESFRSNIDAQIITLSRKGNDMTEYTNPARVKCVVDQNGRALYFSRSPIPANVTQSSAFMVHLGIYGFKVSTLIALKSLDQSGLESIEKLEQLKWLDHGFRIDVLETEYEGISIDTPQDLAYAESLLRQDPSKL